MADLVATIFALQRSDLEAWIREELVVPRKETSALIEKERSVGELAAAMNIRDSTVSQHLALRAIPEFPVPTCPCGEPSDGRDPCVYRKPYLH